MGPMRFWDESVAMRDALAETAKRMLPGRVLDELRKWRNSALVSWESAFAVDKAVLCSTLRRLGLSGSPVVFVLSAYDQMRSIRATPTEVIEILCEAAGENATVVMPTFSMSGLSQEYLDQHASFDYRRTPSRSGLLTEVFRRLPGTERSLHPTHSVAARGREARWLTEGHDSSDTPFDHRSPFQKMLERGGVILRLGQFEAMPFRHLADHLLVDKIPYRIYSDRKTRVHIIDERGRKRTMVTRAHNPDIACEHGIVLERMAREGRLKQARVGRVPVSLMNIDQYIDAYRRECVAGGLRHYLKSEAESRTANG